MNNINSAFISIVSIIFPLQIQRAQCMNPKQSLDGNIAQLLSNKGYLPDDKDLIKPSIVKSIGM